MSAKFLSTQLLNSSRFAVGKIQGEEGEPESETKPSSPSAEDGVGDGQDATPQSRRSVGRLSEPSTPDALPTSPVPDSRPVAGTDSQPTSMPGVTEELRPDHLDNILRREDGDIRRTAVSESITETVQSRREVLEQLRETTCEIRQRTETLDAYRKLLEATAANIAEFDPEITENNVGTIRRAIENARIEIARFERDAMKRQSNTPKTDKLTLSVEDVPIGKLLKIGLALTWPVVLALIAAAIAGVVVLFNLFAVN